MGRASRTKKTLLDFHELCRATRHPLLFRGLTSCQRTPGMRGVSNSPKDEFVLLREKGAEMTTSPWGRFISPRENDAGRFKECSSRNRACSPKGKFPPLNDKILGKVNSPRKKARERHVSPLRPMFPKGGPISPRYIMKYTRDHFTSPRGRFFSSREKITYNFTSPRNLVGEKEKHVRCIIPLLVSPGQRWHVV